jgi:hypothetical protein
MMTVFEKSAYRGTLLAMLAVTVLILAAGFIGERIHSSRDNLEKSEGFIADLQAMATGIPRTADGGIQRQGPLSTAWLYDAGALPKRLQAMGGSLAGGSGQQTLGLVRRSPWSTTFPLGAGGSLLWAHLANMPQVVCEQFAIAVMRHQDQVAYISAFGNPAVIPAAANFKYMCSQNFNNVIVFLVDPATEIRRLSADIGNAIGNMPADEARRTAFPGAAAPFQVHGGVTDLFKKSEEGGPAFIEKNGAGIKVTINNVPFAVCRQALLQGPQTFAMDAFETVEGTAAPRPLTDQASDGLCAALKGRLVMTRRAAG